MAWEGHDTIEEVKAYPLNTSLFYFKLSSSGWPSGVSEMFFVTQGVELQGGRYYLASTSVEHQNYPPQKSSARISFQVSSNYFEASSDNESVKLTHIMSIPGKGLNAGSLSGSVTQTILHSYISKVQSLRKVLSKREID